MKLLLIILLILIPSKLLALPHVQVYVEDGTNIPFDTVVAAAFIGLEEQLDVRAKFSWRTELIAPACVEESMYSSINFISQDRYLQCWTGAHPTTRKTAHWARMFLVHPYASRDGTQIAYGGVVNRIGGPGSGIAAVFDRTTVRNFWHAVKVLQHEIMHLLGARHNCDIMSAVMCAGVWLYEPALIDPRNLKIVNKKLRNKKLWMKRR